MKNNQHEIKESKALLDNKGNIAEPGWARSLLPVYDRSQIKKGSLRIKEWDYYLITNGKIGICLTIDDNGYMGLDSISFLNFEEKWEVTKSPMRFFPMGKTNLPNTSLVGDVFTKGKDYFISFKNDGKTRVLEFFMDNFKDGNKIEGKIQLSDEPKESMVICTPFEKDGCFYYNQKINCMKCSGNVKLGDVEYKIDDEFSGTLDWGRGVWTYNNTWYWGSASGFVGNTPFGWNIGYGFGDTSAASENVLFYNGKIHKLDQIKINIPDGPKGPETGWLDTWTVSSNDGRFEMQFDPILDRSALTDFKVLKSDQHQVFGRYTGKVVLDDNTEIKIKDFFGFIEKVTNKW